MREINDVTKAVIAWATDPEMLQELLRTTRGELGLKSVNYLKGRLRLHPSESAGREWDIKDTFSPRQIRDDVDWDAVLAAMDAAKPKPEPKPVRGQYSVTLTYTVDRGDGVFAADDEEARRNVHHQGFSALEPLIKAINQAGFEIDYDGECYGVVEY